MKTLKICLLLIFCLAGFYLSAQQGPPPGDRQGPPHGGQRGGDFRDDKREEIESMKIGFITRKLDLTPDEAKKFWPVYNQYSDELKKLRDGKRNSRRDMREGIDSMSDKEVEKIVDDEIVFRQQELDIIKKYHGQFKQVLPMKKVAKLYRSEEEFKRELLEKLKERRNDDGGGRK